MREEEVGWDRRVVLSVSVIEFSSYYAHVLNQYRFSLPYNIEQGVWECRKAWRSRKG